MEERKSESREPKSGNEVQIPTAASSSSAPPPPPPPPWIGLPEDLTANILQRLGAEEILESAQKVCTTWWRVCKDPATWRVIDLRNRHYADDEFLHMCRCAVDRSQGQLIDLKVACREEDGLLNYVAER